MTSMKLDAHFNDANESLIKLSDENEIVKLTKGRKYFMCIRLRYM